MIFSMHVRVAVHVKNHCFVCGLWAIGCEYSVFETWSDGVVLFGYFSHVVFRRVKLNEGTFFDSPEQKRKHMRNAHYQGKL